MKNVMIALMLLATIGMTAQRNRGPEGEKSQMTTQEKATLATKKQPLH